MTKIAIHQPNYLPWPGYFLKMMMCDSFIFLDHVQFSKGSYTNRSSFHIAEDKSGYLTVPVTDVGGKQEIRHVKPANLDWHMEHTNKLKAWLGAEPYISDLEFLFEYLSKDQLLSLADINIDLIKIISSVLNIECRFTRSVEAGVTAKATKLIGELVQNQYGSTYISGVGFNSYYNQDDWPREIPIMLIDFGQYLDTSFISTHSIVGNIARHGSEKVAVELARICEQINLDKLKNSTTLLRSQQ